MSMYRPNKSPKDKKLFEMYKIFHLILYGERRSFTRTNNNLLFTYNDIAKEYIVQPCYIRHLIEMLEYRNLVSNVVFYDSYVVSLDYRLPIGAKPEIETRKSQLFGGTL